MSSPEHDIDIQCMLRLKQGEDLALNEIIHRWKKPLTNYLYRCLQNETDAIDLAQETFVRIYQNRLKYKPSGKFTTWLFTIATNLYRNHTRWQNRHPTVSFDHQDPNPTENNEPQDPRLLPHQLIEQKELSQILQSAIHNLPHDLKTTLLLFEYQELSYNEISKILNCSEKSVETRIYRARHILKQRLTNFVGHLSQVPKKNSPLIATLILLLLFSPLHADDSTPQAWLTTSYSQRFNYSLEANIEFENRFSTETPHWQHYEIAPNLIWHYSPRYDFSIGYENTGTWTSDYDLSDTSHQATFSTTLKLPLKDWNLWSRQRFQFGTENDNTAGIFRQKTQLDYNARWLPLRTKIFLSDEWFFDLLMSQITENRLQLGIAYQLNRVTRIEIYGMRLDSWQNNNLTTTPVAGLNINLTF